MKYFFLNLFFFVSIFCSAQNWQSFTDSIGTFSSARSSDLNGDGIMDIVIGGGTDSMFSNNGVMAYNGVDGSLLWKRSSRDELFGSAIFQDLNSDGINDVIISGRAAQLLAIDGYTGSLLWDFFPFGTNPADSGLYNFYNPQFIDDVDGDSFKDILISNGGDHSAPSFQSNRPPGHLMVISAQNGNIIEKAVVPDSSEIYCSPLVADIKNDGNQWVLYGTGGENYGGSFYAVLLSDLLLGDISNSIVLDTDPNKGFIAPAAIHQTSSGSFDIIIQSYDGLITKIDGQTFSNLWTYQKSGTESSAEPVIGNFTGDLTPDVLLVLFNGVAPSYNDYFQVMLDGQNGSVQFIDSLGAINFASANAVDLNNDGRDEGVFSITYFNNGYFVNKVQSIDFNNDTIIMLDQVRTGVNIASTPLITDLDGNGLLDLVYSVREDSLNPVGLEGINVYRHELTSIIPNSGIAWGSYLGTNMDGTYNSNLSPCWPGTIISNFNRVFPSCNGSSDGSIILNLVGTPPYTYLWSNQSTDSLIDNLSSGTYWVQVTDSSGCYEIVTINLPDPYAIIFGEITSPTCVEDTNGTATVVSSGCPCMFTLCTFLWDNGVTSKTNTSLSQGWHSVAITHASGCVVVDSVFIPSSYNGGISAVSACDSYTWDSITYTSSGIYFNTYTDTSGCDSVHTLNLTLYGSDTTTTIISSCNDYIWNGFSYDSTGLYSHVFTNENGCDSLAVLDLRIFNSDTNIISIISCDSYNWNGISYDSTGTYSNLFTDENGCDSLVDINLTISSSSLTSSSETSCDNYIWDGIEYLFSGVYTNTYSNSQGCDSTHTLNLTINTSDTTTINVISCESYLWNGTSYDSSGVYSFLYNNSFGCDSLVFLDLSITNTIAEIIAPLNPNNIDLSVNVISGISPYTYVWNTGETTPIITPSNNGEYWVVATDNFGCISDTVFFNVDWITSNLSELNIDRLSIFPNPSNDIFYIQFKTTIEQYINLRIFNIIGEEIYSEFLNNFEGEFSKNINLQSKSKGVYYLEITTPKGIINKKLILQ